MTGFSRLKTVFRADKNNVAAPSQNQEDAAPQNDALPPNENILAPLSDELHEREYSLEDAAPDSVALDCGAIAFEEVVERYHGKVFQLVYRYLGDYDEACDITQDTFIRAYRAWDEFRGESQIYTWLYRIAINLCHNQQKKLQRRRQVERVSLDAPLSPDESETWSSREVADERPLPGQTLERREVRLRTQQALAQLPENYRTVILLRDMEGLSYEQIAVITGSTLEAIKSRLFRARGAVRKLMEPYIDDFDGEGALLSREKTAHFDARE